MLETQRIPSLLIRAGQTSDAYERRFCSSCGAADHEGRCEGPPGPPSPPTYCPFCGVQRGANQVCCDVQNDIVEGWQARDELERWARANAIALAELALKRDRTP